MSNGTPAPQPTDEERITAIASYEGSFSEMQKLALETVARTARDPLFCFELAISMMRLIKTVNELRAKQRGLR